MLHFSAHGVFNPVSQREHTHTLYEELCHYDFVIKLAKTIIQNDFFKWKSVHEEHAFIALLLIFIDMIIKITIRLVASSLSDLQLVASVDADVKCCLHLW